MSTTTAIAIFLPYGLAFFVLGTVAFVLRRTRASVVPLFAQLRHLQWFGITHGIVEWWTMLLIIEAFGSAQPVAHYLLAGFNALSFWFLLRFGIGLENAYGRLPGWARLPVIGGALWAGCWFLLGAAVLPRVLAGELVEYAFWFHGFDALTRYALAFPAALLSARALVHTARSMRVYGITALVHALRLLAAAFFVYGIATGLIVTAAPFPPASAVNTEAARAVLGFPVELIRAAAATAAAFAFVRIAREIRDAREDRLSSLREQQIVAEERERLAHDLHDRVIQTLFAAGLRLEQVTSAAHPAAVDTKQRELLSIRNTINDSIREIRGFVYRPNGAPCDLSTFALTVTEQMERLEQSFGVSISVVFSETAAADSAAVVERPFDLTSILVEAVANAVRHGKADRFEVHVEQGRRRGLLIRLQDNAEVSLETESTAQAPRRRVGHDVVLPRNSEARPEGLGLASIHIRTRRIGGSVSIRRNGAGDGTVLEIVAPLGGTRENTQRS